MKRALVCGAGGFIGSHLVTYLKGKGYWVFGVDLKSPEFGDTNADKFRLMDLRRPDNCRKIVAQNIDEVYQLAADMGGMGFISTAECDIMRNNVLINANMIDAAARSHVARYFFSSSVCVYRDMQVGELALSEAHAIPANPDNEYGWEKLYSERMALAYGRKYPTRVRIARFQNCYGPQGTWQGGREKAPAAICRKVVYAAYPEVSIELMSHEDVYHPGKVEVWGDGQAVRSYIYVDDLVDGIYKLMQSSIDSPANIGSPEYVTVDELANVIIRGARAQDRTWIKHVDGPVGVASRNFNQDLIESTGWEAQHTLAQGIYHTYPWIKAEIFNRYYK